MDTKDSPASINHIKPNIPAFWAEDPDLWFEAVEAQFQLANISQENTISASCPQIINKDPNEPYTHLKKALLASLQGTPNET